MSGIKRLNIDWTYQEMDPHPEGELVYFDDHAAEIARLRAEADALRVDSERLNWLESQVKEYGDGHYSRLEASLIFFWQQTKPDEVYPGFRESIDAAMGADA